MKKKIIFTLILILTVSFITILYNSSLIKYYIKENVGEEKYLRASQIKKLILNRELDIAKYQMFYNNDKYEIFNSINKGLINVNVTTKDTIIKGKNFTFNFFPKIFPSVGHGDTNTNYIDFYNDDLVVVFKNGIVLNCKIDDNQFSEINILPNNLNTFIGNSQEDSYFNSFITSKFGIKDILISGNQIYASYVEEIKKDGFNTSILKAEISDSLIFEKFFSTDQYIDKNFKEFYPIQSGGRIVEYGKDSVLFSVGDYRYRVKAQDSNSINGKILSINKFDQNYRIVSMGHRNAQGLDYLEDGNYIISTEHGPSGGDEVNFNSQINSLSNFGWPISSYGIHYELENAKNDNHSPDLKRRIKNAPLYKSHSDHGFIEPIKYFDQNPGISEVKFVKNNDNEVEFIVATLGTVLTRPYVKSLLHMKYNIKENKTELIEDYIVNGRVRDLIIENGMVWYSEESKGTIGSFKLN